MNKIETLERFARGCKAWNEWADGMSAERAQLEEAGEWSRDETDSAAGGPAKAWMQKATADFSDHSFKENADFSYFRFPYDVHFRNSGLSKRANFRGAWFSGDARFNGTRFCEDSLFIITKFDQFADFSRAKFQDRTQFYGARFLGCAEFEEAIFFDKAQFFKVQFESEVNFRRIKFSKDTFFGEEMFSGTTRFDCADFHAEAYFSAIRGKTVFSLDNARFTSVPDFEQADFGQAPRIDRRCIHEPMHPKSKNQKDPARWCELKRLAAQRSDHTNEIQFFRSELKARREVDHKPWQAVFWVGHVFEWCSDFGISILRPLGFWALGVVVFAGLYYAEHADRWSALNSTAEGCIAGSDAPVSAAVALSLKTALVVGAVPSQQADRARECLFGTEPVPGNDTRRRPVYPVGVAFLAAFQFVWSAAMLFLFALGLRNQFRIK